MNFHIKGSDNSCVSDYKLWLVLFHMNIVITIFIICKLSRLGTGPTQHTSQSVPGAVSFNVKEQDHEVERSHPSSVGVGMSATVLLFPHTYIYIYHHGVLLSAYNTGDTTVFNSTILVLSWLCPHLIFRNL
jgi:hypothetical protein